MDATEKLIRVMKEKLDAGRPPEEVMAEMAAQGANSSRATGTHPLLVHATMTDHGPHPEEATSRLMSGFQSLTPPDGVSQPE